MSLELLSLSGILFFPEYSLHYGTPLKIAHWRKNGAVSADNAIISSHSVQLELLSTLQ